MNAFLKMTWTEMKLFAREPVAMFFTFAFPIVILIVFGSIFGNDGQSSLRRPSQPGAYG